MNEYDGEETVLGSGSEEDRERIEKTLREIGKEADQDNEEAGQDETEEERSQEISSRSAGDAGRED